MKKYTVLATLMMLAAAAYSRNDDHSYFATPASYNSTSAARVERGYLACLATGNDGVMESALAHVAMMKLSLPDGDYRALESRVAEVSRTAASQELRYKAFLTGMVLSHAKMFEVLPKAPYETPDELFGAISSKLGEYYSAR